MKKALLITRPNYDDATGYLHAYSKAIIDQANRKGIDAIDLEKPRLTRQNFESFIGKHDPILIFFNAHGDKKVIYGDKIKGEEEILVEENKNHDLLKNRIVYARACLAAASLGKACTKEGGCFIGYKIPFSFWADERWSSKPLNDKTAKVFIEPSNLIVSSLLKGNTTQEAFDKSIMMMKKNILDLLKRKKEPGTIVSISVLWSNMKGQDILGERDITIDC